MELEKAKEIHSSQNWTEIVNEIDSWIKAEEQKLRVCITEQLSEIQITIKVLEKVKNLPQVVIDREE